MSFDDDIKLINFMPVIQTFSDCGTSGALARVLAWGTKVGELVEQGAGVYWCINPQDNPNERGINHTSSWSCVGLDLDVCKEGHGTPIKKVVDDKMTMKNSLERLEYPPTGILESKNGLQAYWFFEPIRLHAAQDRNKANETYKEIVKGIERVEGLRSEGDSICRVLRLPGSLHKKNPLDTFEIVRIGGSGLLVDFERFKEKYHIALAQQKLYEPIRIDPDSIYSVDVVQGLQKLSGSGLVVGEVYEFEEIRSGKRQIIINGKRSGQWIDVAKNAIGGHPGGEGSFNLVRWVKYHHPELSDKEVRGELDKVVLQKTVTIQVDGERKKNQVLLVKSGFEYIDKSIGGFRCPGTYVIAGYEKSGKSTLLINFASNMIRSGITIGYIDTELSRQEITNVLAMGDTDKTIAQVEADESISKSWEIEFGSKFLYAGIDKLTDKNDQLEFELVANLAREFINRGVQVLIFDNLTTFGAVKGDSGWAVLASALMLIINLAKKYNVICFPVIHVKGEPVFTATPDGLKNILKNNAPLKIFDESITIVQKPTGKDLYGGGAARSQLSGTLIVWRPYQLLASERLSSQGMFVFENFSKTQPKGNVRFAFDGSTKKFTEYGFQNYLPIEE